MTKQPKEQFSVYTIKKGDTLESVASFFEKTQQEIKGFHNIFCKHEDYIVFDFPENLEELYVYPYLHYKAIGLAEYLDENTYLHHNKQQDTQNYTVQYISGEGENKTEVNFDISITYKGVYTEGHLYVIHKISPTHIDGEITPNDTEEIKEKLLDVAYPLQILVQENGMWQQVVFDAAVKKRFETAKQEILEYFKGKTANTLLKHAEENLCHEASFKKMFENNWLLDTLFSNIYRYYNHELPIQEAVNFAMLNHSDPLTFDVEQNIGDFVLESKQITINRKGILNDSINREILEAAVGETKFDGLTTKTSGNFQQKIILDRIKFNIDSIYLLISIDLQTPRSVEVNISMVK